LAAASVTRPAKHADPSSVVDGDQPGGKLIIGVPAGLETFFAAMEQADVDLNELQHQHGVTFL
jgi:hypothetical protein